FESGHQRLLAPASSARGSTLHIPDDTDACTGAPPERSAAGIVERNVRLMVTNSSADLDDGQHAGLIGQHRVASIAVHLAARIGTAVRACSPLVLEWRAPASVSGDMYPGR